jgi:phosphatidate cytidylyltransferase
VVRPVIHPPAIGVVLLAGLALGSLFLWRPAFLVVVAAAIGVGIWELVRAIRSRGANPPLIPLVVGGALMTGLGWWGQADALTFGLVVTVVAVMVWRLADGVGGYGRDITAAALVAVYVPFLAGFAALLASPSDGGCGCSSRWRAWCCPTPAATSPGCCSASIRWRRR